ncbi:SRPBCC family protein [Patiriisocius hiemis]|uniref:SRPBCC family protein n=1 Tax=Patiriisocius hiemis TaxID=3075604 RepID=A0ABU2YFE2_9FLAO|nr:SRPBCC family protein [Constantimarinum sp. W242]MDT0556909.1 SRPBCC family protein [Constantimarinum sp. W242]
MTTIKLHTIINTSCEEAFNLSRDIDFHTKSASQTNEKAIAGKMKGKIGLNETVTWKGKHFGFYLKHTSKIIQFEAPNFFTDIMIKGHFTYFAHQHFFKEIDNETHMEDVVRYKVPYGIIGKFFNKFFLKKHLETFLKQRNSAIKNTLEAVS